MSAMIEDALNTYLRAQVTARTYPVRLPQDATLPALRYQTIAKAPQYTHGGESGLEPATVQISAFAETYAAAKVLSASARTALSAYSGTMGTIAVGVVFCGPATDLFEEDAGVYHVTFDAVIWYAP